MNNEPNKKNGAKPAVAHKKNILDDRRIRLALSVLGAIVAWMVVTIIVQRNRRYNPPSTMCGWIIPTIPLLTPPGA